MNKATYRIGPSDFFAPSDLAADAETVNGQIALLEPQVLTQAPVDFVDQWTSFESSWRAFYADHFAGFFSKIFTAFNDSNRDQLIQFENQLGAFQDKAKDYGASLIGQVDPSAGAGDNVGAQLGAQGLALPSLTTIVVVAGLVIVALFVWKS
jgi:hypothetical protein